MTAAALLLIAVASLSHAVWNLLTKRSVDKLVFVWWTGVVGSVLFLPLALWHAATWPWPAGVSAGVLGAAVLRAAYLASLSAAYTRGDLSLVYPLARGAAPALVPPLAILILGERLTPAGAVGVAIVVLGVYVLHLPGLGGRDLLIPLAALRAPHTWYALLTGAFTVTYSLTDKWTMSRGVSPVLYAYLTIPVAVLLLTPLAVRHRDVVGAEWRLNRAAIAAVAVLMTGGYLLVLIALTFTPVSYVAPARELGIVFGTLLGARLLGERHLRPRLTGAALIVLGIAILAGSRPV